MKNHIVYFDESGNTEAGFRDRSQPFITFSSHSAKENFCKKVINEKFSNRMGMELKYKKLDKRKRVSQCIETFELLKKIDTDSCFKVYTIYKPLYLFNSFLTFFHDSAIESIDPNFNTGDFDFIYGRLHKFWFHFLKYHGPTFLGQLITCYTSLISERNEKAYCALVSILKSASEKRCEISRLIFNHLNSLSFDEIIRGSDSKRYHLPSWLDTTLPCVIKMLGEWSFHFKGEPFEVIHDNSAVLHGRKHILEILRAREIRLKKECSKIDLTVSYVLPQGFSMDNISFQDSRHYFALQMSDLLAGMINDFSLSTCMPNKQKSSELNILHFDRLSNFVRPEDYLHMIPNERLANQDDLRYLKENNISAYL